MLLLFQTGFKKLLNCDLLKTFFTMSNRKKIFEFKNKILVLKNIGKIWKIFSSIWKIFFDFAKNIFELESLKVKKKKIGFEKHFFILKNTSWFFPLFLLKNCLSWLSQVLPNLENTSPISKKYFQVARFGFH